MKLKLPFTTCFLLMLSLIAKSQAPALIAGSAPVNPQKNFANQNQPSSPNNLVASATDTLDYFFNKHYFRNPTTPTPAPNLQFLTISSPYPGTVSITHCGAIFLNNTSITVNGLEAIVAKRPVTSSLNVPVKLYLCNVNTSNLPVLPALDSVLTNVSSSTGVWVGGNFTTAVTVTGKFAVLVKVGSTLAGDSISLFLNNACNSTSTVTPAQRFGEGLGVMRFNGTFYPTTGIFSNGPSGNDYEFIVAARVGFGFSAGVSAQSSSICTNSNGSFSNTTTPVNLVENRQFNFNKFAAKWGALTNTLMPITDSIYNWTFTGSTVTGTLTTTNATALFNTAGNQVATLNVKYKKSASNAAFNNIISDIATATINVTSQASPSLTITGAGPLCAGNSATLTVSGNATYTWTNPSSNAASIVVTPTANTTYSVSAFNVGCIGTQTALVSVATTPTVSIVGTSSICSGGVYTLVASGASSYTWTNSSFNSSISVTSTTAGVQSYTVTGQNAPCPVSTAVANVTVNATPSVSISASSPTVCTMASNGHTIALSGLPAGGNYGGNSVSGSVFTPSFTGNYVLTYAYTDITSGCSKTASTSVIVGNCTGLADHLLTGQIQVYPNPANGGVVYFKNLQGSNTIALFNMLGVELSTFTTDKSEYQLDLNNLADGNYFARVVNSNGEARTIKFVNQATR